MKKLFILEIIKYIPYFFRNKAIPLYEKITAALIILYIFNPFDIVPETLPGLGLIDDLLLIIYLYKILSENHKNTNEKTKKKKNVIENVDYKVKD